MWFRRALTGLIAGTTLSLATVPTASAVPIAVDFELALVWDVSGSVDSTEFILQRDGWASAFNDAQVKQSIVDLASDGGGVAVSLIAFGTVASTIIDWQLLQTAQDATDFAADITAIASKPAVGTWTNIAAGIEHAIDEIRDASGPYEGEKRIIDVSSDGRQNRDLDGSSTNCNNDLVNVTSAVCTDIVKAQRDSAQNPNLPLITINGLAIDDQNSTTILDYFTANVITSDGFVIQANDTTPFTTAARDKIRAEVEPPKVPEPGTLAVFAVGLAGLGWLRRRRNRA